MHVISLLDVQKRLEGFVHSPESFPPLTQMPKPCEDSGGRTMLTVRTTRSWCMLRLCWCCWGLLAGLDTALRLPPAVWCVILLLVLPPPPVPKYLSTCSGEMGRFFPLAPTWWWWWWWWFARDLLNVVEEPRYVPRGCLPGVGAVVGRSTMV